MWIRSQNKTELINTERVQVDGNRINAYEQGTDNKVLLGDYETQKRAAEVLDQVQLKLTDGYRSDIIIGPTRVYRENVFEMPEE